MFDVDVLAVGDGEAIALRHTDPATGTWVVGVVDAGFADDDGAVIKHVNSSLLPPLDETGYDD